MVVPLKLYDTLTKSLVDFRPIDPSQIKFYQCGPTVYWVQHIGNMRAMVMSDLIRRSLVYMGYGVKFVRNYTDVGHLTSDSDTGEDKMAKGAKREGLTPDEIADKYITLFEADVRALNTFAPDVSPRATKYVQQIIEMTQTLLEKGYAYTTPKAVYFSIEKFANYNQLNHQKLADMNEGAGKGDVSDPDKRNSVDFALWFFKTGVHANALQTWESPFISAEVEMGRGFPGWHIECSAMTKSELGATIDIHMGGVEHISIHHTNEIAQSESANGQKFVNYWLHNEHLLVDNGKMSKSSGTSYSLEDVRARGFEPMVLRYFFLGAHYRSKQNFTWEALTSSQTALSKLRSQLGKLAIEADSNSGSVLEIWRLKFTEALSVDFNVPVALAVIWEVLKSDAAAQDKLATVLSFDQVLGLELGNASEPQNYTPEVEKLILERQQARDNKDWATADKIRDQLLQKYGIKLADKAN